MTKIALIIGSLSRASINRTVAQHLAAQAPEGVVVEEVQIGDLPLYTQDLDSESIPAYERVRAQLQAADAVLIVSPEHNRSMPAALKNAIDVCSRPAKKSVWNGKPLAVITASPARTRKWMPESTSSRAKAWARSCTRNSARGAGAERPPAEPADRAAPSSTGPPSVTASTPRLRLVNGLASVFMRPASSSVRPRA